MNVDGIKSWGLKEINFHTALMIINSTNSIFMIKEVKQTQEVTIKHKYCDDCGTEIKRDMACSVAKCEICGKDLCNKCIGHEANTMGDYREVYCKKCWEIGTEYRLKIEQLENEIENLSTEWHNQCLS